jgi:hypothetical protein
VRAIKSLADVQIILKQLLDWQSLKDSKDWDFKGLRIKNASPSKDPSDYVVRSELQPTAFSAPSITGAPQTQTQASNPPPPANIGQADQYYTIVFSTDTPTDAYETPPFNGGFNRDGTFVDVWVAATGTPLTNPALVNFRVNGLPFLTADISLPAGSHGPVHSSLFVSPLPVMGKDTLVTMRVTTASGVTLLSGGIVVKRNK